MIIETYLHEWISWETSTHYAITKWNGPGTIVKIEWIKKNKNEI